MNSEEIREEALCRIALALNVNEGAGEWEDIPGRHWNAAESIVKGLGDMIPKAVAYRTLEGGSGEMTVDAQGVTQSRQKAGTRQRQFVGDWFTL